MWQQDRQGEDDSEEEDPEDESGSSDDDSRAVSPRSPAILAHSQSQPGMPAHVMLLVRPLPRALLISRNDDVFVKDEAWQ